MCGFLLGALCLIALVAVLKHHHGPWGGCSGHGSWGGRGWGRGPAPWDVRPEGGPCGGNGFFRAQVLRHVSQRVGATPGQEKVIAAAADEVMQAGRTAHEAIRAGKQDLAATFAGPSFDESLLGDVFSRQDDAIRNLRLAVTGALGRVHEALEPEQRQRLAELIARGPRGWAF